MIHLLIKKLTNFILSNTYLSKNYYDKKIKNKSRPHNIKTYIRTYIKYKIIFKKILHELQNIYLLKYPVRISYIKVISII